MKRKTLPVVLLGGLLLTGCSGATEASLTSESTPVSPTPTVEPGTALKKAFKDVECESTQESPFEFVTFVGTCGDMEALEFNKNRIGTAISKDEALDQIFSSYIEAERSDVWFVTDDWAVSGDSYRAIFVEEEHPEADIYLPPAKPSRLKDQISLVTDAVEDISGVKCDDRGKLNGQEMKGLGCKKDNGNYYAILGFFSDYSSREMSMVEPKEMFRFAKRDTYVVMGDYWIIYDVPHSDAIQLAATLDADWENLAEEP